MDKAFMSAGDGAISLRCPKLGGVMVPVDHLLEFDYDEYCQKGHKCNKCGVFRKDAASGNACEVMAFPCKPSSGARSVSEGMNRPHCCNATRERNILRVSAGMFKR